MRSRFDEQLALLNRELIEMGALCEEVIALAMKALDEEKSELIQQVFTFDGKQLLPLVKRIIFLAADGRLGHGMAQGSPSVAKLAVGGLILLD